MTILDDYNKTGVNHRTSDSGTSAEHKTMREDTQRPPSIQVLTPDVSEFGLLLLMSSKSYTILTLILSVSVLSPTPDDIPMQGTVLYILSSK